MANILSRKVIITILIPTFALFALSLFLPGMYLYLEFSLLLLLILLFITSLKTENEIIANIFGNLLFVSFFYSILYINVTQEQNGLFNLGIMIISFSWIIIFNRYFKLEEKEQKPILEELDSFEADQQFKIGHKRKADNALNLKRRNSFGSEINCETASFIERRMSFEVWGTLISVGFVKLIFDLQIIDQNIRISKEVLSNLYSVNLHLFGIILTAIIVITVFITGEQGNIGHRKKKILVQGIKGILLFSIPIIFLSIFGIILNMDLNIGRNMLSIENTIATWIFSMSMLLLIFCISFIVLLIHDLLEIEGE